MYFDPRKKGPFTYGEYTFDYEPFYVGKGKSNQYLTHLKEAQNNKLISFNKHKFYKIKQILKLDVEPIILKVEENLIEQDALDLEIWLIWSIGRNDLKLGPLTNMTDGGEGSTGHDISAEKHPMWGKRHSNETLQKISNSLKGNPKLSRKGKDNPMFGKPAWNSGLKNCHSEETLRKIGESSKGRVFSEEAKLKIGNTHIGNKYREGKMHSEETKRKMSESQKRRFTSDEARQKISESHKRKTISIDQKLKISERQKGEKNSFYGKRHSEETKLRMKESWKKRKENKVVLENI